MYIQYISWCISFWSVLLSLICVDLFISQVPSMPYVFKIDLSVMNSMNFLYICSHIVKLQCVNSYNANCMKSKKQNGYAQKNISTINRSLFDLSAYRMLSIFIRSCFTKFPFCCPTHFSDKGNKCNVLIFSNKSSEAPYNRTAIIKGMSQSKIRFQEHDV